jgi:dihydroorotase
MSFNAARIALDAGVMPFTIGGDVHGYTIRRRDESSVWGAGAFGGEQGQLTTIGGTGAFSLAQVMNELIALGVALTDVIRMVTVNAASMLDVPDELGSLAPGRVADVSVLAIDEDDWTL